MTVRVKDRGAEATVRFFDKTTAREPSVDVGVIGSDALVVKDTGVTIAQIATWAELGLGQPQRSWLRGYIEENEEEINKRLKRELISVVKGNRTLKVAMSRFGAWMVGEIQERIARGINPPNAPSTIAQKGSSTPLIDTGQFRSSISSRSKNV